MRKLWAVLALVGALAMVPVFRAEAGGGTHVKTDLYVAKYVTGQIESEIVSPLSDVGDVHFRTTTKGQLTVHVLLKKGLPNTEYVVFIPPSDGFGNTAEQITSQTITTNDKGSGSLKFARSPVVTDPLPTEVAVVLRNAVNRFDATSVFRTPDTTISWK